MCGRRSLDTQVVSWVRWRGRLADRPGKPKCVKRVNRECLAEALDREVFKLPPPEEFVVHP